HLDGLLVEVDDEIAGVDDRLGVALGAAHDGVDARDQLVLVERLGEVVVGAEAETLHLVLDAGEAGQDQDRRLDLGDAQRPQHLEARHVRQVQIEQDDVVVVQFSEVDTLFAEIRRVDVEALGLEHQFDRLRSGAIVLNQQDAHASPLLRRCGLKFGSPQGRPRETPVKPPWDAPIRNLNGAWLTNADSGLQRPTGQFWPNRRKMLPKSGFLATVPFKSHVKSRLQPTRATHPFQTGWSEASPDPNDGDVMINAAGKQAVKAGPERLPAGKTL